jgi:integrase
VLGVARKMKLGRAQGDESDEPIKPFTCEQLAQFLETARVLEPDYYALLATMAFGGLRVGEAIALQWTDLDVDNREIRVSRTLAQSAKGLNVSDRLGSPKSGKARVVDMNAMLVPILGEWQARQRVDAMRRGAGGEIGAFAFPSRRGTPLEDKRVRTVFGRILTAARLPLHHTPHCLRHTFCTLLLAENVPVTYVMAQAGHASIDMTVRIYGRWIPRTDRSLIDRINGKLAPARAALLAAAGGGADEPSVLGDASDREGADLAARLKSSQFGPVFAGSIEPSGVRPDINNM